MSQTRTEIRALLSEFGLSPRKRLGQHFLADGNMIDKIVDLAGAPEDRCALEIGAGTGTLTKALADRGFSVRAYEVDRALGPLLDRVLTDADVDLRLADATSIDASEYAEGKWVLVANLPYNVGTPILLDLLRSAAAVERCVVMVQREVADRLTASPGSKDYGVPSVVVGLHGEARRAFTVPPQVFVPPPAVDSAVVVIERVHPPEAERDRAAELAVAGFGQRRKMLRSSLRGVVQDVEALLAAAGVDPTARAEELSADQFLAIARAELP